LLAISRQQFLSNRPLDLNETVRSFEGMLRSLPGDSCRLEVAAEPSGPTVMADPSQIKQILANLAQNAREAMPRGGY